MELTVEGVMFAPIINLRGLMRVGSRVAEYTMPVILLYPGGAEGRRAGECLETSHHRTGAPGHARAGADRGARPESPPEYRHG
jgi:hypothetical protein